MCSRNLKISVVLILILVPLISSLPQRHSLSKRSTFFDLGCKGVYNKSYFFRLDRICEDCYQLFRETTVHRLCKHQCFTTQYFKGCVDVLHLNDEIEIFKLYIKVLNGGASLPTPSSSSSEDCFGSEFFDGCMKALQMHKELDEYLDMREVLGKK